MEQSIPLPKQYELNMSQARNFLRRRSYGRAAYSFVCARQVARKLIDQFAEDEIGQSLWERMAVSAERGRKEAKIAQRDSRHRHKKEQTCLPSTL